MAYHVYLFGHVFIRIPLLATTYKADFSTRQSVDNRYDFEPFSKGSKFTDLDFGNGQVLLLPDGLSEYMDSGLGIAKPFDYNARWTEVWQ